MKAIDNIKLSIITINFQFPINRAQRKPIFLFYHKKEVSAWDIQSCVLLKCKEKSGEES